ncbi:TPA: tetratricopeptide repeat protein, partial [bacterium]|nr:tetratricopeptide repeat protein [bacterium]
DSKDEKSLHDLGLKLFQRIFFDQALEKYNSSEPSAIALSISGDLALIPWELLNDGKDWVARKRGIIRISSGRKSPDMFKKAGDLKVLVGISSPIINETMPVDDPDQVSPIDVDAQVNIFKKLEGEPFPIQIKMRNHLTRENLIWELSENHHVFHFVGHGNIGRLLFETRHSSCDLTEESWIREQITHGIRGGLRLVVLNSCHSADSSKDVFGVANTIMETGLPASIAIRDSISELADLTFTRTFYQALANGKAIDEAVMLSRQAMASDWEIGIHEWATPVLFVNESLLDEDVSLSIIDTEDRDMMAEPIAKIIFPPQAEIPPMMTREQKFVGRRRELSEILLHLDPQRRDSVQVICLHGEAGIGKTSIAIEATYRMTEWFNEIIYLSGRNAPPKELREHVKGDDPLARLNNPEGFLMALAHKLGLEITGDESPDELRNALLKALSGNEWRLLVFDSMEGLVKSDIIRSLLGNLPEKCKAIITSREALEINERQIHVSSMNGLDSLRLLRTYGLLRGAQINVDELLEIVHFTGGHPMAMRLVISQVVAGDKPLANVLKDLKKAKGTIFDYIFSNSLKLALKDGRKLFAIMSLFYPTVSRKALQEVSKLNDDTFDKALKRIVGLSLIESYQQGKRFGLHNLARLKSEQLLSEDHDKEKYQEFMTDFYMDFLNATVPMTQPDNAVKAIESQMPEGMTRDQIQGVAMELFVKPALKMMEVELPNCLYAFRTIIDEGKLNKAIDFYNGLGNFMANQGYWHIIQYYNMKMAELSKDQSNYYLLAISIFNLATISHKTGKWKHAIEAYNIVIDLAKEFQSKSLEAEALTRLGNVYRDQGDFNESINCFELALSLYDFIENDSEKAGLKNSLGMLYFDKNELDKAICYFKEAYELSDKSNNIYGKALALGNLGNCYQNQEKYEDAIKFYNESGKFFNDLGNKLEQSNIIHNIGVIQQNLGDIEQALKHYQESLEIKREIGDVFGQLADLTNISSIYAMQKSWTESANACIEAFQIAIQLHSSVVMDSLKNVLEVSKTMLKSGEFATPAQLIYLLTQMMEKVGINDDEMRTALAISQGVFTIIGFVTACEWNKSSDIYKEALELAKSLDESTGSALRLVEWLEY